MIENRNTLMCAASVARFCVEVWKLRRSHTKAIERGYGVVAPCGRCGAPEYFAPARRHHSCPVCGWLRASGEERDVIDHFVNGAAGLLVEPEIPNVELSKLTSEDVPEKFRDVLLFVHDLSSNPNTTNPRGSL